MDFFGPRYFALMGWADRQTNRVHLAGRSLTRTSEGREIANVTLNQIVDEVTTKYGLGSQGGPLVKELLAS